MNLKFSIKHYKEQLDIIKEATTETDNIKYVVVSTGRQIGKTLTGLTITLIWALSNPNSNILIIQPTYKQLKKLFRQFEKAVKPLNVKTNKTDLTIEFSNGSFISLVSGESKDSVRGNSIHYLWVDEAAFIQDEVFYAAIQPIVIAVGRVVLLTSTPRGKGNYFHKLFYSPNSISITFSSATSPLIKDEDLENARQSMPPELFEQEYLAKFLDGSGTVFTSFEKNATLTDWIEPELGRKYYGGIDWAKQLDKSVLTIIDDLGRVCYIKQLTGISWELIIAAFVPILKKYNAITGVETNGIGDPLFEQLQKQYSNIEDFTMSNKSKENIILLAVKDFNTNNIQIPKQSFFTLLYDELSIFTFEYLPISRTIRYTHPPGMHDDSVISLCIANYTRHQYAGTNNIQTYANMYDEDQGFW